MSSYQVKHQLLALGSSDFRIRSLLNLQQFSDDDGLALAAGISSASWSLFGQIWPSARVLADAMQTLVTGEKRILEIGCGLGLASMVLQRRLANITASDCHPLTELFLRENARLNHLPNIKYQTGHWDRPNPDLGQFDVIIASDVLYERQQPESLSRFITRHAAPLCEVIVVDPNRGNRTAFCRLMKNEGYAFAQHSAATRQTTGETYRGRFLNFSKI